MLITCVVTNTQIAATFKDLSHTVLPTLNTAGKPMEPSSTGLGQDRSITTEQMRKHEFK